MQREPAALFLAIASGLAACRGASVADAPGGGEPPELRSGFDPVESEGEWRAGDRVVYELSTSSGKRARTKLVEIELIERARLDGPAQQGLQLYEGRTLTGTVGGREVTWNSALLCVAVRVYEPDGELLQETEAEVPESVLRSGVLPAVELCEEWSALGALASDEAARELSDEEARVCVEAVNVLPGLLQIIQEDRILKSLLMEVVGTPSLLSLLGGIRVSVSFLLEQAHAVPSYAAEPSAFGSIHRFPVHLAVNDQPMLDLELDVAASDPPLRLAGGILALRGARRGDPDTTVKLELCAARRGSPGAEIRFD